MGSFNWFLAGEITQVIKSIPWVRCASGNVFFDNLNTTSIGSTGLRIMSMTSPQSGLFQQDRGDRQNNNTKCLIHWRTNFLKFIQTRCFKTEISGTVVSYLIFMATEFCIKMIKLTACREESYLWNHSALLSPACPSCHRASVQAYMDYPR